ncbi:nucleotide exchange factor GrpE [Sandaracinobacteroides saxicola]|uniref:Protein GrpE n=1 Tax=Sandaracinobacteroides saxicola TaxID=2759707 RepID=A0A7G5IGV4_9SPHN|nr:nucleotide exchange factor GrpE [Sandaracinobacteroides saxicola]QMW22596.1 nucleotide exchange factor GrpE [Sandaracinobacteroides saxicola]
MNEADAAEEAVEEKSIEQQLEDARAEIVALTEARDAERDRALRAVAEAENVRRRLERDKADAVSYAAAGFARDMLAVADNLARALAALPADTDAGLKGGLEATERELHAIFGRHGIKRVAATGLPLDPNQHQAMVEVEHEAEPGTVVSELQAGYVFRDRLLRPALVTVAKPKTEAGITE